MRLGVGADCCGSAVLRVPANRGREIPNAICRVPFGSFHELDNIALRFVDDAGGRS
jgi:hypothetical protein